MVKQSRLTNLRWEKYNEVDDGGKVGAFTIIGIVLFIAGILFVGRIDIWAKPQMTITGDFTQVNGLKMGIRLNFPAWLSGLFLILKLHRVALWLR